MLRGNRLLPALPAVLLGQGLAQAPLIADDESFAAVDLALQPVGIARPSRPLSTDNDWYPYGPKSTRPGGRQARSRPACPYRHPGGCGVGNDLVF
jgi:hypothetical protein